MSKVQPLPVVILRHLSGDKQSAIDRATQIQSVFPGKRIEIFGSDLNDASITCEAFKQIFGQEVHRSSVLADHPIPYNSRTVLEYVSTHKKTKEADLLVLISHLNPVRDLGRMFGKVYQFGKYPEVKDRKRGEWYLVDPLQRRVVEWHELLVVN